MNSYCIVCLKFKRIHVFKVTSILILHFLIITTWYLIMRKMAYLGFLFYSFQFTTSELWGRTSRREDEEEQQCSLHDSSPSWHQENVTKDLQPSYKDTHQQGSTTSKGVMLWGTSLEHRNIHGALHKESTATENSKIILRLIIDWKSISSWIKVIVKYNF